MPFRQDDFEAGIAKIGGLYWGIVADVADPLKRGRVRVNVPGLIEPTEIGRAHV